MAAPAPERIGRYRLIERLGQGGMATVYRAEDTELKRDVALKLMHPFLAENQEASARFQREARSVAMLRHPNVLQVHDYSPEDGDRPAYLVCELIQGPTLREFLSAHGAPLPEVAAMIGVKLANALTAAHAEGIVHRDVKPENVMVDQGRRIVLCDFGIARWTTLDATMTKTGAVIGSPAYMSPEQAEGTRELDERSDLFSLGTVLYFLATGALPFSAKEPLALLARVVRGEHLPPSAKNPRVPPYLERVIEKCLRVDLEARFQKAEEVAAALEAGLKADGMREIDKEIADYFRDPPEYNRQAEPRIVQAALEQARAAAAAGEVPRALGQCNRVLAWRPEDAGAQALIVRLGRRGRLKKWAAIGAAVVAVAGLGGVGWGMFAGRKQGGEVVKVVERPVVATVAAMPTVTATPTPTVTKTEPQPEPKTPAPTKTPTVGKKVVKPVVEEEPVVEVVKPVVEAPVVVKPVDGEVRLIAKPYCIDGKVDGTIPIDKGKVVALAPGSHRVKCGGPGGNTMEREFTVVAGEKGEVVLDFQGLTAVKVKLTRGDAVLIDKKTVANEATAQIAPGMGLKVFLLKGGVTIGSYLVDIPGGSCTLHDDPWDCVKP